MRTGPPVGQWSVSHVGELATVRARAAVASDQAREGLLVLAVSELATNALKYGSPPVVISLHRSDQGWLVDARDGNSDQPPLLRTPTQERLGGHGLWIISQASTAWGWYCHHTDSPHKHIWAHIPVSPAMTG